jgi:CAAX prenyl protease-like protein
MVEPQPHAPNAGRRTPNAQPPWYAYVIPTLVFSTLTWLESQYSANYSLLYSAKVLLTSIALIAFRSAWRDFRFSINTAVFGMLVGIAVCIEWVLVELYVPYTHLGMRVGYDPFSAIHNSAPRALFLAVRFYGLILMVPVIEELFWRSFLLRYFTNQKWQDLQIGEFSWGAFAITAAGFSLVHSEWLPALICAIAYGLLLRQSKSLFACMVAHIVTNLCLGMYIIVTGNWKLW